MPCCSAAMASSSNEGTVASAEGSRCATDADPGGCAHSDKNRNAPSDSVAIDHVATHTQVPLPLMLWPADDTDLTVSLEHGQQHIA